MFRAARRERWGYFDPMDVSRIATAFDHEGTPLVRTDFTDDGAWESVVALVTAPVDFGVAVDEDDGYADEGYRPHVEPLDDRQYDGVTAELLGASFTATEDSFGYVLLADARSMTEARTGGEVTVDYVDLSVWPDEDDAEDGGDSWLGRSFRCATAEIASIEANLSIANLDFDDFASNLSSDGVYRGETEEPTPLQVPEADAGLAASVRIGRDVDGGPGARVLSGPVGSVEVVRRIRGTRRRLFLICAHLTSWSTHVVPESSWTWSGMSTEELGSPQWAQSYDHADQLTGRRGAVQYSFVEVERPRRAVRSWQWLRHPSPGVPYIDFDRWIPVLAEDSTVSVDLVESDDGTGETWTEVTIRHDGLPVEWLDDMRAWWGMQLAIADHADFGAPQR